MKFVLVALCIVILSAQSCSNWNNEMSCQGNQVENPPEFSKRTFQTPPRNHPRWNANYQDMSAITGYPRIMYNRDRNQANVSVIVKTNPRLGKFMISYSFDNQPHQHQNHLTINNQFTKSLSIQVFARQEATKKEFSLKFESLNFLWQNPQVPQGPQYENGQKGAIAEMFGWPYQDIEHECDMLGKSGYLGVKVFPPQEAVLSYDQLQRGGELNPWYFVYQPVSYRLTSRMGTRDELRKMIITCRSKGVRVYADAVVNHMTGTGNDVFPTHRISNGGHCAQWGPKNSSDGSPYFTHGFAYETCPFSNEKPGLEFPAVPYEPHDFHCERPLRSWSSGFDLNYGWLVGLTDLNTEKEYVQQRIADYFTDLLSIGFSGFRIDAAKHISPKSLAQIFKKMKQNLGGGDLPNDFITWLEVILGGEKELLMCADNDYSFGKNFEKLMRNEGLSHSDIFKIKIWSSDYPKEHPICGHWVIPSERLAIQNDDHDQQFDGSSSRDMGDKGSILLKDRDINRHRSFNKQLFARNDGNWKIRLVLSSYTFRNGVHGFPDGLSDCKLCRGSICNQCKSMPKSQAFDAHKCGYEGIDWNGGVYTRTHRDLGVIREMRRWMGLNPNEPNSNLGLPSHCQAF